MPGEWDNAFLFLLYKGKGSRNSPDSYRGITLKSHFLKLFESILCARLRSKFEGNGFFGQEQLAYRKGKMGTDHLYSLLVARELAVTKGTPLFASFIDLKKAFPSIPRQKLLDYLGDIGVSDRMRSLLCRLYSNDSFQILIDGVPSSEIFKVEAGVHEGSPLSPLLFILYIEGLVNFLKKKGVDRGGLKLADGNFLFIMLYADDVLLIFF